MNIIDYSTVNSDIKGFYFPLFESTDEKSDAEKIILKLEKQKKAKGCYLIYEDYQTYDFNTGNVIADHNKIIPVYVGRTVSFYIRMWQHRNNRSPVLRKYFDAIDNETWQGKHPLIGLNVDFWLIEDEKERNFKEHELIGLYRPVFNKL